MSFQHLNAKRLPTVMVYTLALSDDDRQSILDELRSALPSETPLGTLFRTGDMRLAEYFRAVLDFPAATQKAFAEAFDRVLDILSEQDFFGTEAQNDPRGDRRDDD